MQAPSKFNLQTLLATKARASELKRCRALSADKSDEDTLAPIPPRVYTYP
jgi:hypothetical protein